MSNPETENRAPLQFGEIPESSDTEKTIKVGGRGIPQSTRKRYSEPKRTIRKAPRIRSSEQEEMIRIRKTLGFSQQQFATALNVNRDRIVNIENGRVLNVPPELLRSAQELLNDPEYLAQVERLRHTSMKELLDTWWERLGIEPDGSMKSDRMGAQVLGVHINSIYRWRRGEVRPDMESLVRMEAAVDFMVHNLQKGDEAFKAESSAQEEKGKARGRKKS